MSWTQEEKKAKLIEFSKMALSDNEMGNSCLEVLRGEFVDYLEDGTYVAKYPVLHWQRNPMGNLQGGFLAAMIDNAAGGIAWVELECQPIGTVDMNINYIRAVRPECDHVIIKARVISIGRQVILSGCTVYDPEGWEVAKATTNVIRMLPPDTNPTIVQQKKETFK